MKRNIITIIILSLAVSACCEKEGSFLGTIIKNRATQIAAAAQLESVITKESSTLNANAAAITADKTQTAIISTQPDAVERTDLTPKLQATTIKTNEIKAQAEQKLPGDVVKKTIAITDNKPADLKEPASQPEKNEGQTVAKLNDIELDNQSQDKFSTERLAIVTNNQKIKDLKQVEAVDQPGEITDLDQTIQIEIASDREVNDIDEAVTAAIDKDFSTEPIDKQIEQVIEYSSALNLEEPNADQKAVSIFDNIEEKNVTQPDGPVLGSLSNANTRPIDKKAEKLTELISLLNEEDNTAIEEIIKQAKSERLISSNGSESDRNTRLLELLSKDIKKQADKTNSKVSQQSLDLLNEILSE